VKKMVVLALVALLLALASPVVAKTHHDSFAVPCSTLWAAVKDTLKNSGKYGIVGISNEEMTASYIMGGNAAGKRMNSVVLNPQGEGGCDLQVQTAYTGLIHNDAGDFKERVESSLAKHSPVPAAAATPVVAPAATPVTTLK